MEIALKPDGSYSTAPSTEGMSGQNGQSDSSSSFHNLPWGQAVIKNASSLPYNQLFLQLFLCFHSCTAHGH